MNKILETLPPSSINGSRQIVRNWIERWHSTKANYFAQNVEESTGFYPDHSLYQSRMDKPTVTEDEMIEDSIKNFNHIF